MLGLKRGEGVSNCLFLRPDVEGQGRSCIMLLSKLLTATDVHFDARHVQLLLSAVECGVLQLSNPPDETNL